MSVVNKSRLDLDSSKRTIIYGYGNGRTQTLGEVRFSLKIEGVEEVNVYVVSDAVQNVPLLVGHLFTETSGLIAIKNNKTLKFTRTEQHIPTHAITPPNSKTELYIKNSSEIIPNDHVAHVALRGSDQLSGDFFIEPTFCLKEGNDYCIPATMITVREGTNAVFPVINLSDFDVTITSSEPLAKTWPSESEKIIS